MNFSHILPVLRVAAVLCATAAASPAAHWTAGHGDFTLRYTGSPSPAFSYEWSAGTGGDAATVDGADVYDTIYSSAALTPVAGPGTITSPDPARTGGSPLHLIPQDGTDAGLLGSPFQGWRAGTIPGGLFTGNQVLLRLIGVTGPGQVSLWSDDGFGGALFRWASADGFSAADTFPLSIGGHTHLNLAFTQPGNYQLAISAQATLQAGGASVSTPLQLNYTVIPEPSASAVLLLAGAALLLRRR